jgi:hypothetical protein
MAEAIERLPDDIDDDPVVHAVVPAAGRPLPRTSGVPSIFEWARAMQLSAGVPAANEVAISKPPARFGASIRNAGVLRCVGGQYPAGRWTKEREERERARRARQRPPKPVKGARTRSRKLREMIGEE